MGNTTLEISLFIIHFEIDCEIGIGIGIGVSKEGLSVPLDFSERNSFC